MIRRPPRSTQSRSSAASDVYKRQVLESRHPVFAEARVEHPAIFKFHLLPQRRSQAHHDAALDLGKQILGIQNRAAFKNLADLPDADVAGVRICLLYTSDAADDLLCVDLGGRRII